ncbi:hypothetical protein Pelo_11239 [Pelomyxa schiedti]|nr:hypothetical protein Pelo_11239 [Pelomyxa schiedti]
MIRALIVACVFVCWAEGVSFSGTWTDGSGYGGSMLVCQKNDDNSVYAIYSGIGWIKGVMDGLNFTGSWYDSGRHYLYNSVNHGTMWGSISQDGDSYDFSWSFWGQADVYTGWLGTRINSVIPSDIECGNVLPNTPPSMAGTWGYDGTGGHGNISISHTSQFTASYAFREDEGETVPGYVSAECYGDNYEVCSGEWYESDGDNWGVTIYVRLSNTTLLDIWQIGHIPLRFAPSQMLTPAWELLVVDSDVNYPNDNPLNPTDHSAFLWDPYAFDYNGHWTYSDLDFYVCSESVDHYCRGLYWEYGYVVGYYAANWWIAVWFEGNANADSQWGYTYTRAVRSTHQLVWYYGNSYGDLVETVNLESVNTYTPSDSQCWFSTSDSSNCSGVWETDDELTYQLCLEEDKNFTALFVNEDGTTITEQGRCYLDGVTCSGWWTDSEMHSGPSLYHIDSDGYLQHIWWNGNCNVTPTTISNPELHDQMEMSSAGVDQEPICTPPQSSSSSSMAVSLRVNVMLACLVIFCATLL